jgi:hypothetical protein
VVANLYRIILTLCICQGQECTFKRSVEEDIDSLECAYQRLSSLDILTQMQIAKSIMTV